MFDFYFAQDAKDIFQIGVITFLIFFLISYAFSRRFINSLRYILKLSVILVLLLVLCKPLMPRKDKLQNIALVDTSNSMSEFAIEECKNKLKKLPIKYFSSSIGDNPRRENQSNIIDAILSANANNIVLCSDGFDTSGKKTDIFDQQNITINTLKLENNLPTTQFAFTRLPTHAKIGKTAVGSFGIINAKNSTLEVTQNKKTLFKKTFSDNDISEIFKTDKIIPDEIEFKLYDGRKLVDQRTHIMFPIQQEKVLIIGSSTVENDALKKLFETTGYELVFDNTETDLNKYRTVVLNNISAESLGELKIQSLKNYVSEGGGLLTLGGNQAYGLGNYHKSTINELLPLTGVDPEKLVKKLNSAVMLVLDKSSSMRQASRLDFTKLAAEQVVKSLKDDDYLGIIGFDKTPFIAQELGRLANIRQSALEGIKLLFPTGNTRLVPALDEARKQLKKANAGIKHIVIVTDGELPDSQENAMVYNSLINNLKDDNVTISTFLINNERSPLLTSMANKTGGAFYQSSNVENLPSLFLSDLRRVVGDRTQREFKNYEIKAIQPISTTLIEFPRILGFVATKLKPTAILELEIDGEPLLASWKYQKGNVLSFTSDLTSRWTSPWLGWSNYKKFATDLLSSITNQKLEINNFNFSYFIENNSLHLLVDTYQNLSNSLKSSIVLPNSETKNISFTQTSHGHYEATLSDITAGNYLLNLFTAEEKFIPVNFKITQFQLQEKPKGVNRAFLEELAMKTNGKLVDNLEMLNFDSNISNKEIEIRPLILIALFLYLLNIYLREIWDRR